MFSDLVAFVFNSRLEINFASEPVVCELVRTHAFTHALEILRTFFFFFSLVNFISIQLGAVFLERKIICFFLFHLGFAFRRK